MNLHIVPDSKFSQTFIHNLEELGVLGNNRIVVRTNQPLLKHIDKSVPFGKLHSDQFRQCVGDTADYDTVYIHQFSPLMYRWVAENHFRKLKWMVWGADLYNLPFVRFNPYETLTLQYQNRFRWRSDWLYVAKVYVTNMMYKDAAYRKVNSVLTWMKSEYTFACRHIKALHAAYEFFFYENQLPYHQLDERMSNAAPKRGYILGNSGTPTNNHLDALSLLQSNSVSAELLLPVSYGDVDYVRYIKKEAPKIYRGPLAFLDTMLPFDDYLTLMRQSAGLVLNHLRPQGYGNIFMMMYLGKPVFLNPDNISLTDLSEHGLVWYPLSDLRPQFHPVQHSNREPLLDLLSHPRLMQQYTALFS